MSHGPTPTLVIVGGGMAANRLIDVLLQRGYDRPIRWIGAEPTFGYNRVLLPEHLRGTCSTEALGSASDASNIERIGCTSVEQIDRSTQVVRLSDGLKIHYHTLVLATGGIAPPLTCEGSHLAGILTLRSLADSEQLKRRSASSRYAVVIGGGLLGLEAGKALLDLGLQVQVIHRRERLLNRQLDQVASELLQQKLTQQGFVFRCGAQVQHINGTGQCESITLDDGTELPADLIIVATGTQPDTRLAEQAGLRCKDGVSIDLTLQTSDPQIYALGECARTDGVRYALVEPIYAQAETLAASLAGEPATFHPPANNTRLKIAGISLFAAGQFEADGQKGANEVQTPDQQQIVIRDSRNALYRRLCFQDHRLSAAVLLGDITGARAITNAMHTTIRCAEQRQQLALGINVS